MYLVGMMGQNMIYNIIGTGLYFYFQSVIFIPAMAISIFMPTVFAVFTGRYYGDHHTDLL